MVASNSAARSVESNRMFRLSAQATSARARSFQPLLAKTYRQAFCN